MSEEIGIIKKIKLGIWLLFNKDKYLDYIDSLSRNLLIYNKWSFCEESGWSLTIITSTGEIFQKDMSIADGRLEEAKQIFTQDVKIMYNGAFDCPYEIVNVLPNEPEPKGYRAAADKCNAEFNEDEPHIYFFDFLLAMNKIEEEPKVEEESFYVSPEDEIFDFSHVERG